ncbi:MAG: hypothetical protein IJW38_01160 [Clostridia bacterium]|nr:hypothetical protein [Clostridia bacterium]
MKKRIICAFLAIVMLIGTMGILASCGGNEEDPAECEHVDKKTGKKDGADGICDKCGEELETKECKHVDKKTGKKSGPDGICDKCGEEALDAHTTHPDKDGDEVCDVEGCDEPVKSNNGGGDGDGGEAIYWDSVDLTFMMTDHDTADLSSTCRKYLAGDWGKKQPDIIGQAVIKRNGAALDYAKVGELKYNYRPNTEAYGWEKVGEVIVTEITTADSSKLPDMYCDQVYGMVAASLQNCFANLYGTVRGEGQNLFPFNDFKEEFYKGTFDEDKKGQGYMYEYMTTLTLSKNKMYLLASDYFTDLVRAFYITPVNVTLLEEVGMGITGDYTDDGEFTIDDFYEEVKAGKWTYSKVAEYSAAIYMDEENQGTKDMADRLGFVLCSEGGLSTSGVIYSTSCTIINRDLDKNTEDFKYSYPETNEKLYDLFDALADLVAKDGVYVAGDKRDADKVYNPEHTLRSIAARFAANKVLFGGVCLLGSLEEAEFQSMKGNGGFGVAPVPLYSDEIDDEYLTSIHNEGRIGAISQKTTKFEQCTAYLHYQSTNSTKILDDYYTYKLQEDVADATPSTVYMMQYIRNHVRSAFDKTFEDAMGAYYGKAQNRWHDILMRAEYSTDLRQRYSELYDEKETDLKNLVKYYDDLKD